MSATTSDEITAKGVMREALQGYLHDADFYAEVQVTTRVVDAARRAHCGAPLPHGEREALRVGAMVALHLRNEGRTAQSE